MRLQKYMALCGVAARRKCEDMIRDGRVTVNGRMITQMGTQVEEGDVVAVDGAVIAPETQKRYILYHKPAGEVTTVSDEKGRETVMDRFAGFPVRLYPVGRLDYDSEGPGCCSPMMVSLRSGLRILPARFRRFTWPREWEPEPGCAQKPAPRRLHGGGRTAYLSGAGARCA